MKHLPDVSTLKYKYRYCLHGDIQTADVDYFKTYDPIVQWSTIFLALTMILSKKWYTKQVDYTNTFYQAYLKEEVYIHPNLGFGGSDGISNLFRLIKRLYGVFKAPKTFFGKIQAGLLENEFIK